MLKNGIVKLSGFCETTFYVGWDNDEPVDGSFFETDKPCTNTFPPQDVLLEQVDDEGGYDWYEEPKRSVLYLANPKTKEVILEAGTVWYDSYYPMGRCYFNPTALPINK